MRTTISASILVAKRLGVLENARTRGFGGARQALSVFERMQVAAARVEQPAEIALAAHVRLQFGAIEQARRAVAVLARAVRRSIASIPRDAAV